MSLSVSEWDREVRYGDIPSVRLRSVVVGAVGGRVEAREEKGKSIKSVMSLVTVFGVPFGRRVLSNVKIPQKDVLVYRDSRQVS